jgi:hypothetical protein
VAALNALNIAVPDQTGAPSYVVADGGKRVTMSRTKAGDRSDGPMVLPASFTSRFPLSPAGCLANFPTWRQVQTIANTRWKVEPGASAPRPWRIARQIADRARNSRSLTAVRRSRLKAMVEETNASRRAAGVNDAPKLGWQDQPNIGPAVEIKNPASRPEASTPNPG